jgi:very-short-patch-repair endonuclease
VLRRPRLEIPPEIAALDSPIEWLFEQALRRALAELKGWSTLFIPKDGVACFGEFPPSARGRIVIAPQIEIGSYVADFGAVIQATNWHPVRIAYESDGHAFHERTPEQVKHDRARDRYFTSCCIHTVRYTGSEIVADARYCADEALQIAVALSSPDVRGGAD